MKIGGVDPKSLPSEEYLVLPRGESRIVFIAKGLPDMDEFHAMVPEPKAPGKLTSSGYVPNTGDPGYLSVLNEYQKRRLAYIVVKSIEPSLVEWDTVKLDVPATWANWEADMKLSGLTQIECNRVLNLALQANSLDDAKLKAARESFLLGLKRADQPAA